MPSVRSSRARVGGDAGGTREALLAAATQLFRTRGFEGTSIEAIGAAAGVRGPALYYHFASKGQLLQECLAVPLRALLDQGREAVVDRAPLDAVRAYTETHVAFQLAHFTWTMARGGSMVATGALIQVLPARTRRELYQLERGHLDTLRTVLADGAATGELRTLPVTPTAFAIIGMADQVITWYRDSGSLSPEQVAALYADLAVAMVRPDG
jgi:AcrR family transcriptional regulator